MKHTSHDSVTNKVGRFFKKWEYNCAQRDELKHPRESIRGGSMYEFTRLRYLTMLVIFDAFGKSLLCSIIQPVK